MLDHFSEPPIVHLYGSGFARPEIMFFQNVDAIIGPDEPIVYPEHRTEELDYEFELAVVPKKSEKHFRRLFFVQPSTH